MMKILKSGRDQVLEKKWKAYMLLLCFAIILLMPLFGIYIYIYNYFSSLSFWVFKLIKKNYKIYLYLWIYININLLLYTIAVVGIYGALEPSVNGSSQEQVLSKGRRNFTASATNLVTSTTGI